METTSVRMPRTLHQPLKTGCQFSLNCIKMHFHETPHRRIVKKRRKQTIKAHSVIKLFVFVFFLFAILFLPCFNWNLKSLQISTKFPSILFHLDMFRGFGRVICVRTDKRRTDLSHFTRRSAGMTTLLK